MNGLMVFPADQINLAGAWGEFWGAISGAAGGILTLLAWAGVVIVIGAIVAWLFERKRGGGMMSGQKSQGLIWAIVLGALMAGPEVIIPALLKITDWVANTILNLLNTAG